jgi:hypothetical protein
MENLDKEETKCECGANVYCECGPKEEPYKLSGSLTKYIKEKHTQEECTGFIDGYEQCLEDLSRAGGLSLYQQIENAIIGWSLDGTKTAGSLTREIIAYIELEKNNF